MKRYLVTRTQALKLKELGFDMEVCHYGFPSWNKVCVGYPRNWNKETNAFLKESEDKYPYLSIPTVFEAFVWLGRNSKSPEFNRSIALAIAFQIIVSENGVFSVILRKAISLMIKKFKDDNKTAKSTKSTTSKK